MKSKGFCLQLARERESRKSIGLEREQGKNEQAREQCEWMTHLFAQDITDEEKDTDAEEQEEQEKEEEVWME